MNTPNQKMIELMNENLVGKRVRLIQMNDPQAPPRGTEGEITGVDCMGTIHVKWDNGSSLGLIEGEDVYRILKEE